LTRQMRKLHRASQMDFGPRVGAPLFKMPVAVAFMLRAHLTEMGFQLMRRVVGPVSPFSGKPVSRPVASER